MRLEALDFLVANSNRSAFWEAVQSAPTDCQSKRLVTAALAQKILGQALHRMADDRFDLPPSAVPERALLVSRIRLR